MRRIFGKKTKKYKEQDHDPDNLLGTEPDPKQEEDETPDTLPVDGLVESQDRPPDQDLAITESVEVTQPPPVASLKPVKETTTTTAEHHHPHTTHHHRPSTMSTVPEGDTLLGDVTSSGSPRDPPGEMPVRGGDPPGQPAVVFHPHSSSSNMMMTRSSADGLSSFMCDAPHVALAYDAIPILEQTKLPRGGLSVETKAVGRVQVRHRKGGRVCVFVCVCYFFVFWSMGVFVVLYGCELAVSISLDSHTCTHTNSPLFLHFQFGLPPETIKDSMSLGIPVPQVYIVPLERFCREMGPALGVNLAEFEFPAYFNYFVYKKRCTLVVDSVDAEDNIRRVFGETLLGPAQFRREVNAMTHEEEDFARDFPREAIPNFAKEFKHFRIMPDGKELVIETLLEFCHFEMKVDSTESNMGVPPPLLDISEQAFSCADSIPIDDASDSGEETEQVPANLGEMEKREKLTPWTYSHAKGMGKFSLFFFARFHPRVPWCSLNF
jgi:hypothetical protein